MVACTPLWGIGIDTALCVLFSFIVVVWFGVCLVATKRGPWGRARGMWFAWLAALGPCIFAILFFFPMQARGREAPRRAQCACNLRQIRAALENYFQKHGCYPPAYTVDKQGKRLHSWRVLLLPFLDNESLYNRIHLDEPWDSPQNQAVLGSPAEPGRDLRYGLPCYRCPSDWENEKETNYVMIVGPGTISDGRGSTRPTEITDREDRTICVVEVAGTGIAWYEPRDLLLDEMTFRINDRDREGISSRHPGMAHVLLCDGRVMVVGDSTDPQLIRGMITINGGEDVSEFFKERE